MSLILGPLQDLALKVVTLKLLNLHIQSVHHVGVPPFPVANPADMPLRYKDLSHGRLSLHVNEISLRGSYFGALLLALAAWLSGTTACSLNC